MAPFFEICRKSVNFLWSDFCTFFYALEAKFIPFFEEGIRKYFVSNMTLLKIILDFKKKNKTHLEMVTDPNSFSPLFSNPNIFSFNATWKTPTCQMYLPVTCDEKLAAWQLQERSEDPSMSPYLCFPRGTVSGPGGHPGSWLHVLSQGGPSGLTLPLALCARFETLQTAENEAE